MKERDIKPQSSPNAAPNLGRLDDGSEANWGGVFHPATPAALHEEWRPGFWDALVGYTSYIDPDRLRDPESEPRTERPEHRSFDEEDFSSEHGYEPGFEGRSEFEHGEFDRWL